jgi:hypothetical protein
MGICLATSTLLGACSGSADLEAKKQGIIVDSSDYDLNVLPGGSLDVNGALWTWPVPFNVGTGQINPFLTVQNNGQEEGFNTDASSLPLDDKRPEFTNALPLNHVPTIKKNNAYWREFILDANEANSGIDALFSVRLFDLWLCNDTGAATYDAIADFEGNAKCTRIYDLGGKIGRATDEVTSGSGLDLDYQILVPEQRFVDGAASLNASLSGCQYTGEDSAPCGLYLVLHTIMGDGTGDWVTGSTFEELSTVKRPYVTVTKTASTSLTRTYQWLIDKSVTPATLDMFRGDTGGVTYTVALTKGGAVDSGWAVSGSIVITNPSTGSVVITGLTDQITGGISVTPSCPVSFPYTLAAGGSLTCTYSSALPDGATRTNTVFVDLGDLGTGSAQAAVNFASATVNTVNGAVDVTDTNGSSWHFGDSGSVSYPRSFTCDGDQGKHDNTATITQTGQSDGASVQVNCYALAVTKDTTTSFNRKYDWSIQKSSTTSSLTLSVGEIFTVQYSVVVTMTGSADSTFGVSGNIHVNNPAPIAANLASVTDAIDGVGSAPVTCGVTFPYSLAAGGTLNCTYSSALPDKASRTNTATATINNTPSGTTSFTGQAAVTFGSTPSSETDECVNVTDTLAGSLGTVCVGDSPKTYTYTFNVGPYSTCGNYTVDNTASFVSNDTAATGSASWSIPVIVPCEGCTLTQGYWKTHSSYGPAPNDPDWFNLGDADGDGVSEGPNETFFLSGTSWYRVFWTSPKGNAYFILADQYMAAKLNIAGGTFAPASVTTAITWAETHFFNLYTPSNWPSSLRATAIDAATTLAAYNTGAIGPGHCSE